MACMTYAYIDLQVLLGVQAAQHRFLWVRATNAQHAM